jgi:hypothetical protein
LLPTVKHRTIILQKTDSMRPANEDLSGENEKGSGKPGEIARLLWPHFVELWILAAIVTFFVVRVLGSRSFQNIFPGFSHRHLP